MKRILATALLALQLALALSAAFAAPALAGNSDRDFFGVTNAP